MRVKKGYIFVIPIIIMTIILGCAEKNKYDSELFLSLIRTEDFEKLEELIQTGKIDENSIIDKKHSTTLLHFAVTQNRYYEVVQILLDNGADINVRDDSGFTPLMSASSSGRVKNVKLLIKHGAALNVKSTEGSKSTALKEAVSHGNVEIVRVLLKHGADVNIKDASGFTPLHWAVLEGNCQIAEILLHHGANVFAEDIVGRTPRDIQKEYLKEKYHSPEMIQEMIRLLKKHESK